MAQTVIHQEKKGRDIMKTKRIIASILACSLLLSACATESTNEQASAPVEVVTTGPDIQVENGQEIISEPQEDVQEDVKSDQEPFTESSIESETNEQVSEFYGMNDANLLQYVEDKVYADLENNFESDDYIIEDVQAIYISQDYLDELAYNSKSNVYFGYSLEDIENQYNGTKFIFTLGDDGTTVVQPFEEYDDTFDQVVKNVAIGGGVILVCVTVSVVSGGLGAPAVSLVFAAAAKTGTAFALSSGVISAATTAAVTGYQTKDPEATMKAALLSGSESFKWGAIAGSIMGGASEAITIKKAAQASETALYLGEAADETIPTARQAELLALQEYGGTEQVTYLAGKKVAWGTPGGTRPDVVRVVGDHIEAIEVKNYDLVNNSSELYRELTRQITERVTNLPPGSTQRIVLNVQGRGYTQEFVSTIVETIQTRLVDVYPNIPVSIMGAVL
jgi:hypothetical protein